MKKILFFLIIITIFSSFCFVQESEEDEIDIYMPLGPKKIKKDINYVLSRYEYMDGKEIEQHLSSLILVLREDDENRTYAAKNAIAKIGYNAIDILINCLDADNINTRLHATYTLIKIREKASPSDGFDRIGASLSDYSMGGNTSHNQKKIETKDERNKRIRIAVLKAVPGLVKNFGSNKPKLRAISARAIGVIAYQTSDRFSSKTDDDSILKNAVKPLTTLIEDDNHEVQKEAIVALGCIGKRAEYAIPILLKYINTPYLLKEIACTLKNIGEKGTKDLSACLRSNDPNTRLNALKIYKLNGPKSVISINEIIALLDDKEVRIRRYAASTLLSICDYEEKSKSIPVYGFGDKNAHYAVNPFSRINKESVGILTKNIDSKEDLVSETSIWMLGKTNRENPKAIAKLFSVLDNSKYKDLILIALAKTGRNDLSVINTIIKYINPDNRALSDKCVECLRYIGKIAVLELAKRLRTERNKTDILFVLGQIGPESYIAINDVIPFIENIETQKYALEAINKIIYVSEEIDGIDLSYKKREEKKRYSDLAIRSVNNRSIDILFRNIRNDKISADIALIVRRIAKNNKKVLYTIVEVIKNKSIGTDNDSAVAFLFDSINYLDNIDDHIISILISYYNKYGYSVNNSISKILKKVGKKAIPHLVKCFGDDKKRQYAINTLSEMNDLSPLTKYFKDKNILPIIETLVNVRSSNYSSSYILLSNNSNKKMYVFVPNLIDCLKHKNSVIKQKSLVALGIIIREIKVKNTPVDYFKQNHYDEKCVDLIIPLTKDKDPETRRIACFVLGKIGYDNDIAMQVFINCIDDPDANVRDNFKLSVELFVKERSLPYLISTFEDSKSKKRDYAVKIISKFGYKSMPLLLKALKKDDPEVIQYAAYTIATIRAIALRYYNNPMSPGVDNPYQKDMVNTLIGLLDHENYKVRMNVTCALGYNVYSISSSLIKKIVVALTKMLKDNNDEVKATAIYGLVRTKRYTNLFVPTIKTLIHDKNPQLVKLAKKALELLNK